ncbi:NNP family nitrate/nitrite transporter-like MFS transporter [Peribacillus cavernae]|nr:NNP family nitrate/nitrite transporter-like MFS transporter [Peribacillus cavernae]
MIWVILGALGAFITNDFSLSPAEKGLIVATPILGGSVFRVILVILTDRIGPRKTAIGGMIATMVPLLWGWLFGNSLGEIYCIAILLGVAGGSFAAAIPLASRWYPPHLQGLAMGIAGAGNSGTLLATLFGPRLAVELGWHNVLGLAMIPLALVFIAYIMMAKDAPSQPEPMPLKDYFGIFKSAVTWYFCLLYSVAFGGFVGLSSFLSIFFVDQYQLSRVRAGDFVTLIVAAGSFFRPVGGFLADRKGSTNVLGFLFIIVAVMMFGVSYLPSFSIVMILLFVGMACLGMGNGAVFQIIPQRFQKEMGMITGIVGFFVPNLLGTLKQVTGTFATGFLCYSFIGLVALSVLFIARRSWRKTVLVNKDAVKV